MSACQKLASVNFPLMNCILLNFWLEIDDHQRSLVAVFNQTFINFTTSPRKHVCVCTCLIFEHFFLFSASNGENQKGNTGK